MTQPTLREQVDNLVAHVRARHPDWPGWGLMMRPETYALLHDAFQPGLVWHYDPRYAPLEVEKFADCEVRVVDLIGDFVMGSPNTDDFPLNAEMPPSYWLDLTSGQVAEWTGDELARWDSD